MSIQINTNRLKYLSLLSSYLTDNVGVAKKDVAKSIRIPQDISDIIQKMADDDERSFNAQILRLLKDHPNVKIEIEKIKNHGQA